MPEGIEATVDAAATGKVWTQEEHDAYVKGRIDKQAARFGEQMAEKDARIAELEALNKEQASKLEGYQEKQQRAEWAKQVSDETGIPASVLRGDTLEDLKAHAEELKQVIKPYPTIQAGAIPKEHMGAPKVSRADVLGIKDAKERINAMREHQELFPELS